MENKLEESEKHLSSIIELYNALLNKSSQEGDGIWNRFNVMVGINFGFYAAYVYVAQLYIKAYSFHFYLILILISLSGVFVSIWSFFVLLRLWFWQQHWRNKLIEMEKCFPEVPGLVKSFTPQGEAKELIEKDPGYNTSLWVGYTQPFIAVFLFSWIVLLIIGLLGKF